jgi:hypothetical protein
MGYFLGKKKFQHFLAFVKFAFELRFWLLLEIAIFRKVKKCWKLFSSKKQFTQFFDELKWDI